jgi:hypothetical protein
MMRKGVKDTLDRLGDTLVSAFQVVALFVIGATIVWSAGSDYLENDYRRTRRTRRHPAPFHLSRAGNDRRHLL